MPVQNVNYWKNSFSDDTNQSRIDIECYKYVNLDFLFCILLQKTILYQINECFKICKYFKIIIVNIFKEITQSLSNWLILLN